LWVNRYANNNATLIDDVMFIGGWESADLPRNRLLYVIENPRSAYSVVSG